MVQSAFVDFVKAEFSAIENRKKKEDLPAVSESVTGTGRRPILPPSILAGMPEFKTDCGRNMTSLRGDSSMVKSDKLKLMGVLKNKEKRWIAAARASQMPVDPNQKERLELLDEFKKLYREIPQLDHSENSTQLLKVLDSRVEKARALQRQIQTGLAEMEERTETRARLQADEFYLTQLHYILDTLAIIEGSPIPEGFGAPSLSKPEAEDALFEASNAYTLVKGKVNHQSFSNECEELLNELKGSILRPAVQSRSTIMETARTERIHERYSNLMGDEASANVVSKNIEVSGDLMNIIFPQKNNLGAIVEKRAWPLEGPLFPRIEQLYKVVLYTGRAQTLTKSISCLGEKNACNAAAKYLGSNLRVRKLAIDPENIFAVIGVAGSNKRQLEETIKAPIAVVDNVAYFLGTSETAEHLKAAIVEIVAQVNEQRRNNNSNIRYTLTVSQANYLASRSGGGAALKTIATPSSLNTRVLNWRPDDSGETALIVSGTHQAVEKIKKDIDELIGSIDCLVFKGPERAARKLLSGLNPIRTLQRLTKQLESDRDLIDLPSLQGGPIDEFGELARQNKLCAYLVNHELRESAKERFQTEFSTTPCVELESELEDDEEGLFIVCGPSSVLAQHKTTLSNLFASASHIQDVVEVPVGQAQVLSREKLVEIVKHLDVTVRFAGRDRPESEAPKQRIAIVGSVASREEAKETIFKYIDENAQSTTIVLKSMEMRQNLMRNARSLLSYHQDIYNVHLAFTTGMTPTDGANPLELKITGSTKSIAACKEEIEERDEALWEQIKNFETRQIEVARSSVGLIAGAKGANIKHIESVSGALVSQRRSANQNTPNVVFDVKGDEDSIKIAIAMIAARSTGERGPSAAPRTEGNSEKKLSQYERLPFTPASLSRGRGRVARAPAPAPIPMAKNFDQDFPDLGDLQPAKKSSPPKTVKMSQRQAKKAESVPEAAHQVEEPVVETTVVEDFDLEEGDKNVEQEIIGESNVQDVCEGTVDATSSVVADPTISDATRADSSDADATECCETEDASEGCGTNECEGATTFATDDSSEAAETVVDRSEAPKATVSPSDAVVDRSEAPKATVSLSDAVVDSSEAPEATAHQSDAVVDRSEAPEATVSPSDAVVDSSEAPKATVSPSDAVVDSSEAPEATVSPSDAVVDSSEAPEATAHQSDAVVDSSEAPEATVSPSDAVADSSEAHEATASQSDEVVDSSEAHEATVSPSDAVVDSSEAPEAVDTSEAVKGTVTQSDVPDVTSCTVSSDAVSQNTTSLPESTDESPCADNSSEDVASVDVADVSYD